MPDADVTEPDIGAMVLKSDMAFTFEILQGGAELVLRAFGIGILPGLGPSVQVHVDDLLAVEHDSDLIVFSGNRNVVPLTVFGHFLAGSQSIVNRAAAMLTWFIDTFIDLHFDTGLDTVFRLVGAEEDAAVTLGLEFQIENKIAEALFATDHTCFGPAGQHITFDNPASTRLTAVGILPVVQI